MPATGTGLLKRSVGSRSGPSFPFCPSLVRLWKRTTEWFVVGTDRGKGKTAGPQIPGAPKGNGTDSPTLSSSFKDDALATVSMNQLQQHYDQCFDRKKTDKTQELQAKQKKESSPLGWRVHHLLLRLPQHVGKKLPLHLHPNSYSHTINTKKSIKKNTPLISAFKITPIHTPKQTPCTPIPTPSQLARKNETIKTNRNRSPEAVSLAGKRKKSNLLILQGKMSAVCSRIAGGKYLRKPTIQDS